MTVHGTPALPITEQAAAQLAALSIDDLNDRVRIVLPDRTLSELRPEYLVQIHRHVTAAPGVDRDWLRADAQGLFFVSRAGARLDVVVVPEEEESHSLVIDQSGSMNTMNAAVFAGAREVVESLPENALVRVSTFNQSVSLGARVSRAEALRQLDTREAAGLTALRDAIVQSIAAEEADPHAKTTIVVLTDGGDNSSAATADETRDAIQRANARGWRVLFLGANQDAITTAAAYGISSDRALTFGTGNAPQAFRAVSENVQAHRSSGADHFTALQRTESVST